MSRRIASIFLFTLVFTNSRCSVIAQVDAPLPSGVRAVWDLSRAYRESTPTRERICLNGLWRWQPAESHTAEVPKGTWGFFKTPGCWPGISDYMQKDCQTVYRHAAWRDADLSKVVNAWYQREITVPASWSGRKISLTADTLNSFAAVYLDGKKAGEMRFPSGEIDLTAHCRPGAKHLLTLFVMAMPLKAVRLSYTDTNAAREVKGTVARRGLCGDVYLVSNPRRTTLEAVNVDTSVQRGEITFSAVANGLRAGSRYQLRAEVLVGARVLKRFISARIHGEELKDGRIEFTQRWKPNRLWDIHTPQNQPIARVSLLNFDGATLDTAFPVRFGYREFRISGRDFYLNGTRIFLSSVPLDNAQVGAAWATYAGARESLERLKSFGINFVYTHNYDCEPGSHLAFGEILRAADDVGMLVALSQPHFSSYDWKAPEAERTNGYARDAEFYVRTARNHPSVVAYAMSHNATSYDEAKNPDLIDGIYEKRDSWSSNNVRQALRAEAIVKRLDPARIVYHHSSGNLGAMYTENFYTNFTPKQEIDDWFEHWATKGVKPLFLCEYGVPFSWDWTMYRGWYKGKREWGSANVPWDFSMAEWNAQFFGDRAYQITDQEKANIRWEAKQYREGRDGWHRWDYPHAVGSGIFDMQLQVIADYIQDNWRAFRTWGVSAFGPWEHENFWRMKPGVNRGRKELPVDWDRLQRPGFSADYLDQRYERMDLAYDRSDWEPTAAATALLRNSRPLLAYIGGKPSKFTSKDHIFHPGDTVDKQLIVINNSRETLSCQFAWELPGVLTGAGGTKLSTGNQARIPIRIKLPATLAAGRYELTMTARFGNSIQKGLCQDSFAIDVLPPTAPVQTSARIALFDPKGETSKLLDDVGAVYKRVEAFGDLSSFDVLVIGKEAITLTGAVPDVSRVRNGLKVIIFEQAAEVLEQRLGFRIAEYGLRQVFPRVPDHPLLSGLTTDSLRDWRGESTILAPRLKYTLKPMYGPMVKWCGLDLPHVWRCGNQGSVASVLIEKPARGDFLPIVDGGYSLQYSPLMVYREGKGMVVFCQMDVSGRTEDDPAAHLLSRNILRYVTDWKSSPFRDAALYGNARAKTHLEASGFELSSFTDGTTQKDALVVAGGFVLSSGARTPDRQISRRYDVLALGNDRIENFLTIADGLTTEQSEHISTFLPLAKSNSWLAGIGSADLYSRDPQVIQRITGGAETKGDGLLGSTPNGRVRYLQSSPWKFDPARSPNQKKVYRRLSFVLTRLLCNLGVACSSPLLDDMAKPVNGDEKRWLHGLYLDVPEEWDDPYRFFPW